MADPQATNGKEQQGKEVDPMEPWRQMRDNYLDAWAKTMIGVVNTEAYARATGAVLETALSVSTPFREAVEKAMLQALAQLSIPSRADIVSLAERFTHVEMRLDDMDAKLDQIEKMLTAARRPAPAKRRATKGA